MPQGKEHRVSAKPAMTLNQRIRGDIEGRILSGEWPPGHRIPFEHELMTEYGCSRMTVNKVLTTLAEAGMIERRRRAGSFVARPHPHIEQVALDIPDIPMEVAARGHRYGFRLLSRRLRKPRRAPSVEPAFAFEGHVLSMRSLHLADERPFAFEDRVINPAAVPEAREADFSAQPPGSWLLEHVPWTRAVHRISAIGLEQAEAELLQVAIGTPCLVLERQTWRGEQPVTLVRQVFLGNSYDLVARFSPGGR